MSMCCCTSADTASRRPAANIRVPRAWIQEGRSSQRSSNSHWHPYSHSGRQCSPLTVHVPRGVWNPYHTRYAKFTWTDGLWFILSYTVLNINLFTVIDLLPFAMIDFINPGLVVKLFFQWSSLALWLHTNTHHSNADTSQPHCNTLYIGHQTKIQWTPF